MSLAFRYNLTDSGKVKLDSPDSFSKTMAARKKRSGYLVVVEDEGFFDSDRMRRYWFACIVAEFADYMGYRKMSKHDKEYVSDTVLIEVGWCEEKPTLTKGEVKLEAKSIARGNIKKEEFEQVIDAAIQRGAELEIVIPDKNSSEAAARMGRVW